MKNTSGWETNTIIVLLGLIASLIAIFTFLTGKQSIPEIFTGLATPSKQTALIPTNTQSPANTDVPLPTVVVNNTHIPAAIEATETFSPEIKTIWQECGSYEDLNDQVKTIECYESFVNAHPNFFHAWDNLARVYGNNQNYQKALDAQIQSLNVATTPEDRVEAYLGIGVYYYNLGQFASAVKNLEDGAKIEQSIRANHINILVWLSRSYEANDQQQEACQSWKKALELAKNIDYGWAIDQANDGLTKCP